jgi:hypothetical protein
MAKLALINREEKRRKMVEKYAPSVPNFWRH